MSGSGGGGIWSRLVAQLSTREPGTALALVRIFLGLTLIGDLIDIGLSGALTLLWMPPEAGGLVTPHANGALSRLLEATPANIRLVYGTTLAAAAALTLGLGSRPAALVAAFGIRFLFSLHEAANGGHDRVFSNGLFLLFLSRADVTLSLRCWLKTRRWTSDEAVPAWPRYLIAYQLSLIYACTGIQKLGAVWWPMGGLLAIHYSLLLPHWARADWWWIAWLAPFTRLATAVTVLWEILWWAMPVWLWLRGTPERGGRLRQHARRLDLRTPMVVLGVLMHATIWAMMNVGPFSAVTLSLYPALYHPDELARTRRRLRAWWVRRRSQPTAAASTP